MRAPATASEAPAAAETVEVCRAIQALADGTRVRILNLLSAGELCVCDIVELLEQPQPTVSRHLATLRDDGLVDVERRGRFAHYRVAAETDFARAALLECLARIVERAPELARERAAAARRVAARRDDPCPS